MGTGRSASSTLRWFTLAERERQTRIATLDRRHFAAIKPRHVAAFELLP
jgi:hypothetical protein